GNQLMGYILKLTKSLFDVLLYHRHLILRIKLWFTTFRRGPDGICLCTVWIQENLKIRIVSRLLVDNVDTAVLLHKHRNQRSFRLSLGGVSQPFPAVQPFLELPQPVGSHLGESSFVHTEREFHKMFLHRVLKFTTGGIF